MFCVYHDDAYPQRNAQFGPDASLAGRNLGQDGAPVHGSERERFARHADGRVETWPAHRQA